MSDTNNSASFCFWVAYKGRVVPLPAILNAEKRKTYPYEYTSFIDNITVSKTNTMTKNWKQYKYTWQSQNYGLATQTEIPYNLTKAPSTYAYKEIKRTYLVWRDETTDKCFFTVCQDNPERPTDAVNANAAIIPVITTARTGTPCLLILAKYFGASPLSAMCCSVLDAA